MNTLAKNSLAALAALVTLTGEPTAEQRVTLTGWTGWGPLAKAFEKNPAPEWVPVANTLDVLLTIDELAAARDIVDTSFYTSPAVVDAVFDLLAASGFTGGRILEPGCGSGNLMARTPGSIDIQWTGVEIDPISARFARALNPGAEIIGKPLQKHTFRSASFDAVVGNVPFSSAGVHDPAFPSSSLHEYFTLRAIDAVRPGGYIIVVTSRHLLDGSGKLDRIKERADLISAVRLPSGTFDGTAVVADILAFRRHDIPGVSHDGAWATPRVERQVSHGWYGGTTVETVDATFTVHTDTASTDVSAFWGEHPNCVAGTLVASSFQKAPLKVKSDDREADIRRATAFAASMIVPGPTEAEPVRFDDVILEDAAGRKSGSYHVVDGKIHQVVDGALTLTPKASPELKALIALRDAALELIELEGHPSRADYAIAPARSAALDLYTAYVSKFGALNRGNLIEGKVDVDTGEPTLSWRRPTMGGFRRDPDYVSVLALEHFDQDTGEAEPAPILLRRVGAHPEPATSAASPEEALAITLGESGTVDLARVGELLGGLTADQVTVALDGRVFLDPETKGWVTDRDYLSGNVRVKHALAAAEAVADPRFTVNADALAAVVPDLLGPLDIRVQLGATWITAEDIEAFTTEVLGGRANVEFTPAIALWEVESKYTWASFEAQVAFGTDRMDPYVLLSAGLNGKAPVVWDEVYGEGGKIRRVRNQEGTLAAEEKLTAIQERFSNWVWEDEARANRLISEYNRRFNSHVVRRGDGSYLTFPGLDERKTLWAHQRDAVDLMVSKDRVMLAHPVGAGKTLEIVVGAHTLRRLGHARKPLIVVPNHLLEQIAREAQQAYPTGRFLIAAREDLTGDARRLFAARCATGDWDAVVITHQAFTSIGVDPASEERWVEDQKAELRGHLQEGPSGGRGAKQIATAIRKLEERILGLRDGVSDRNQVTFEQLGVDYIMVDEAHYMRRLQIATRAEGFSLGSSKRATDLLLKVDTLAARFPGKPILALFTGTPWSNTLAETFVWQKFLQPDRLREAGVASFDAWAATFVRYESRVEVTPDGSGFRIYRRPSAIMNVPELRLMLADSADLLTADAIGLERPDATWENILSEPGEQQARFVQSLAERADAIRNGSRPQRPNGEGDDNMLVVCNDGRRVALDPQLVGIAEQSTKIESAAQNIARLYQKGKDRPYGASSNAGSFQLVLCDIGTPNADSTQVYGRLRNRLITLGVPAGRVRFVHEAKTDKARSYLFSQCREGHVSVLIGSTDKVGVGTNIQTRLDNIHHLDAPWRPSDIEQREGRGLRPHNLNKHVTIWRYLTEGSFDAFMWQTLERKQRFISQMYVVDGAIREIEDVSDAVLNYAEVKALAAGNPELLRLAEIGSEVKKLRTMRSVHTQSVKKLHSEARRNREDAESFRRRAKSMTEVTDTLTSPDAPEAEIEAMVGVATALREGSSTWNRRRWRGLDVLSESAYGKPKFWVPRVQVQLGYKVVHEISVSNAESRMEIADLAKLLLGRLIRWSEKVHEEPARLTSIAESCDTRAVEAERTAAAVVFELQAELTSAEAQLATLEASLEAVTSEQMTPA